MICLMAIRLGAAVIQSGKLVMQKVGIMKTLISDAITIAILYWGGFFG